MIVLATSYRDVYPETILIYFNLPKPCSNGSAIECMLYVEENVDKIAVNKSIIAIENFHWAA